MAGSKTIVNIGFRVNLKDFSSKIQNANRQLKKYGKQMQKAGRGFSTYLTAPLLAFTAVSLSSYNKQAQGLAQVEAGLKSTGNQVGYTSKELQKMATDLQDTTLFGDEEILKGATAQLLTFTNIANEQFARTQQAALDLATRLDGDLKSASIQLGKALNDPVANLSALSRSGIQFSTDQKKVINALVKTNRLADAQTIILDELEKQYGGSAAAAAKAGTGGITQLGNILGDLAEDFGKIINEALKPFIAKIKEWAIAFRDLSPATKKVIAVVAGLAAAIGPLLVTLGFLMTTVIPGLITAFGGLSSAVVWAAGAFKTLTAAMLANPIYVVAAGIGFLVERFTAMIQKITPAVSKLKTFFNLIRAGGNHALFVNLQMEDQVAAMVEQSKAAEASTKATAEFNKQQKEAADLAKKLSESLNKKQGGKATGRKKVTPVETETSGINPLQDLPENIKSSTELAGEYLEQFKTKLTDFQLASIEVGYAVGDAFIALTDQIISSFETGNVVIDAFVGSILRSLQNIAAAFLQQLILEKIFGAGKKVIDMGKASSNAIVIATSAAAAMGPIGVAALPALIASQLAVVQGAFASIAAFADGGIVGGTSIYGDKILAAVNSGELILNTDQQKTLYGQLTSSKTVEYVPYILESKMQGSHMKMVLKRQDKIDNRTK